jgi:hypothetical protein
MMVVLKDGAPRVADERGNWQKIENTIRHAQYGAQRRFERSLRDRGGVSRIHHPHASACLSLTPRRNDQFEYRFVNGTIEDAAINTIRA